MVEYDTIKNGIFDTIKDGTRSNIVETLYWLSLECNTKLSKVVEDFNMYTYYMWDIQGETIYDFRLEDLKRWFDIATSDKYYLDYDFTEQYKWLHWFVVNIIKDSEYFNEEGKEYKILASSNNKWFDNNNNFHPFKDYDLEILEDTFKEVMTK